MAGEEGALAEKAIGGSRDAFVKLVRMFERRVFALSFSLVGDYHAAQDAAQETFLRAYKAIATLREPEKFGKWVAGIAYKVSREFLRAERKQAAPFQPGIPESLAVLVKEGADADLKQQVIDAANALPDESRALLALKYLEGLSYAEIAEAMEITPDLVKSRLFAARKHLREKLGTYRPGA
ncbi:MAG: sigma-70 family RNA polymerase sigma factor [Planctomycetes bacterium]|jgi:RNA polymerase sigma-70 factor (ECF subfamily)|nr:sigma-70 family RNA polymerase sigma factor [Planctomycetota bacterium]